MKGLVLSIALALSSPLLAQNYGASIPAGIGDPRNLTTPFTCTKDIASASSSSQYDDRSITTGNTIWKCRLSSDGSTFGWAAPFVSPFQATGVTGVITPPTLVGCTSGTASITGATTSMAAIAAPIGSPGTGQINSTAYVSSAGVVTVTLCLPLTLVYTANPVAYKVLVF